MGESPSDPQSSAPSSAIPADTIGPRSTAAHRSEGNIFTFRRPVSKWVGLVLGLLCLMLVLGVWWFLTRGAHEERILSYNSLPSPAETFSRDQLHDLWFGSALTRNLFVSLRRVILGFAFAAVMAIPLGVLCGCFPWINAFFAPVNVFGRNIPIAALIPLSFALFGIGEPQKVMFIFVAVVAFIMMDTATAIADVSSRYIDTAFTLGASRRQIILKVLMPLAMPRLFNSLRLLFGIAFGYIMLAELVTEGGGVGGLGNIINVAQRRGHRETILLVLMVIPAVALAIDRLLYIIQKSLFPHQYGGRGLLHDIWRGFMHFCEDAKHLLMKATPLNSVQQAALAASSRGETTIAAPKPVE
jgi:ABC-type nitrate/sulfonate/bicarbonate transport system permease component